MWKSRCCSTVDGSASRLGWVLARNGRSWELGRSEGGERTQCGDLGLRSDYLIFLSSASAEERAAWSLERVPCGCALLVIFHFPTIKLISSLQNDSPEASFETVRIVSVGVVRAGGEPLRKTT